MVPHMSAARPAPTPGECAEIFRALGDPTRLGVLQVLLEGPARVGELATVLDVEQSLLSHHLQVLKAAGLVQATRDGKAVVYRIAPGIGATAADPCLELSCCQVTFPKAPKKSAGKGR
jgi:ArsR family transcriptional regulator, nickel/cobalt-responsive transcriptional repressor